MRITNSMLASNFLYDLNTNLNNMQTYQQQMATGNLINKASDNPLGASKVMQINVQMSENSQYSTNISNATEWMDTTDSTMQQINNVLQRINELVVSTGNASYGSTQLQSVKDEINQNVSQLSQLMNTSYGGKYIFAGTNYDTKPTGVTTDANGNTALGYIGSDGATVVTDPSSMTMASLGFSSNGTLNFTANGSPQAVTFNTTDTVASVMSKISSQTGITLAYDNTNTFTMSGTSGFSISGSTSNDSASKFLTALYGEGSISSSETASGSFISKSANTIANTNSQLEVEISQGVTVGYNVTSSEILTVPVTDSSGTTTNTDLRTILSNITNHLSSGDTKDLTGSDEVNIQAAITNISSITAKLGALENRMSSAKTENQAENTSLTTVLSNTDDIDYAEASMDFSQAQTVYQASLQVSANILQKSLIDYL